MKPVPRKQKTGLLNKLAWLPLQIAALVFLTGFALSFAGIIFERPQLYRTGLMLLSPLYILLLPILLLMLAMGFVASMYVVIKGIFVFGYRLGRKGVEQERGERKEQGVE